MMKTLCLECCNRKPVEAACQQKICCTLMAVNIVLIYGASVDVKFDIVKTRLDSILGRVSVISGERLGRTENRLPFPLPIPDIVSLKSMNSFLLSDSNNEKFDLLASIVMGASEGRTIEDVTRTGMEKILGDNAMKNLVNKNPHKIRGVSSNKKSLQKDFPKVHQLLTSAFRAKCEAKKIQISEKEINTAMSAVLAQRPFKDRKRNARPNDNLPKSPSAEQLSQRSENSCQSDEEQIKSPTSEKPSVLSSTHLKSLRTPYQQGTPSSSRLAFKAGNAGKSDKDLHLYTQRSSSSGNKRKKSESSDLSEFSDLEAFEKYRRALKKKKGKTGAVSSDSE
ncbi:uncharacterized protein LOC132202791 isoform X2 [Neocloeon triangulifer]|uniref:uncharacterized protein LOC132202791 isoform X2 n=1 Tax=Neocloeon triangulifer TaxID=2078957 RepID=UPI00286F8B48|nr:uncharacterized protein LOC132202791 isoform X2 [Neocloeon triangulifer]